MMRPSQPFNVASQTKLRPERSARPAQPRHKTTRDCPRVTLRLSVADHVRLRGRGVAIQIASLSLDTTTPHGKLLYTFISGLAEFERALLSERTKQGLEAARRRGKRIGRPPKISNAQIRAAQQTLARKEATIAELAARNGVHPWTLRRRIAELDE